MLEISGAMAALTPWLRLRTQQSQILPDQPRKKSNCQSQQNFLSNISTAPTELQPKSTSDVIINQPSIGFFLQTKKEPFETSGLLTFTHQSVAKSKRATAFPNLFSKTFKDLKVR